ncbi:MAG: response regulator [bacterium]|nr:response regulator [bacterium]
MKYISAIKNRHFAIFIILLVWLSLSIQALDPHRAINQYCLHIWDMESGLPANSIYAIRQAHNGYLWIGTQEGLVKFDGLNFQIYNTTNTPRLKNNIIRALYEDNAKTLWIGTHAGGLTAYKNGVFTTYPIEKYKSLEKISSLSEDKQGNLWIGSLSSGLTRIGKNRHIDDIANYTTSRGLPDNRVTSLHKDKKGDLWAVTATGIIKIIKPGRFEPHTSRAGIPHYHTACLNVTLTVTAPGKNKQELWVGTANHGLYCLTDSTTTRLGIAEGLPHPTVTRLYEDRMKNIWVGTDGGGLTRVTHGRLSTLRAKNGLADGFVSALYEDNEGSLWVGTLDGGLHQLTDSKFITYTTREGLPDDYVLCTYQDRAGTLWAGTKGGLCRLEKDKWLTAPIPRNDLESTVVTSLGEDDSGSLWIGTPAGLLRLKAGKLQSYTGQKGLSNLFIKCIRNDNRGNTWVGTEKGLNKFDKKNNRFSSFTTADGLAGNAIQCLYPDSKGSLLVCSGNGLNRVKDGQITAMELGPGFDKLHFQCIHEDNQGTLWFGTDSGLVRFKNNRAITYTHRHGLTENNIYSIMEDHFGCLWTAGRNGISRITKKELAAFSRGEISQINPRTYNEKDGMRSRWSTGQACHTRDHHDHRLWFPTSVGVTSIRPGSVKKNPPNIPLIIEKLIVDGESVPLQPNTAVGGPVRLAPGKKRMDFYYAAVSFVNPGKITFKTKMDGYDPLWIKRDTLRTATYTGLRPGLYTFNVKACYPGGVWNGNETTLTFYLKPFFYQTTWFYVTVALMVCLLIFSGYRFRVRQLKHKARELGLLVKKRTGDLEKQKRQLEEAHQKLQHTKELIESKNLQLEEQSKQLKESDKSKSRFFSNISHEFRTPLTLIMGPLEQILSEKPGKKMKAKASLMLRNSRRLLNLINQLLELAKFDSGKFKLQFSNHNITPFINNIVQCFESLAQQNNINYTFECQEKKIFLYCDLENLERIITNLLANAFNYTPKGGGITLSLKSAGISETYPGGSAEIEIRDTGTGIPSNQLPHIFDRFYQGSGKHGYGRKGTGIGLALTRELVELHHGQIRVESDCPPGESGGTCFFISLPMGNVHLAPGEVAETAASQPYRPSYDAYEDHRIEKDDRPDEKDTDTTGVAEDVKKHIVLVVDDNPDVRSYIKNALEGEFNIIEAADGTGGIEEARRTVPDLIISDIMMPKTDGYELCKTLKTGTATSHIPIILLTAKIGEADVLAGLQFGADDYITKPFNTRVLAARVRNLVEVRARLQLKRRNQMVMLPQELPVLPVDDKFYRELTGFIETHIKDHQLTVQTLTKAMGMGRTTLNKKVRAITGESPNKFIRNYRLQRAAELLKTYRGNIADLAEQVGFGDFSYFTGCFKERFQRLPSQYRAAHIEGGLAGGEEGEETQTVETDKPGPEKAAAETVPGPDGEKELVLVVEDSEDARGYIREALEPDYRVEDAAGGRQGIDAALAGIPDIIVSDIIMPETDGYELCRTLKSDSRTSHIPIVLLTGKVSDGSVVAGLETGADDYVTKPFNPEILRARIANLINLRRHLQLKRTRVMTLEPDREKASALDEEFYRDLQRVIEKNLDDSEFGVEELCKKLYMGRSTLYRKISALSGETPSEFIRSYRLKRAAQLLRTKPGSVLEVTVKVGFSSSSYFARCFREKFHQLPSEYVASQ